MINDKRRIFCLIAFVFVVSGCISSSDDVTELDDVSTVDDVIISDDGVVTTEVTTEVTAEEALTASDATDATAAPVAQVSSAQMDAFIKNPLIAPIPAELQNNASAIAAQGFIANPFMF